MIQKLRSSPKHLLIPLLAEMPPALVSILQKWACEFCSYLLHNSVMKRKKLPIKVDVWNSVSILFLISAAVLAIVVIIITATVACLPAQARLRAVEFHLPKDGLSFAGFTFSWSQRFRVSQQYFKVVFGIYNSPPWRQQDKTRIVATIATLFHFAASISSTKMFGGWTTFCLTPQQCSLLLRRETRNLCSQATSQNIQGFWCDC